jgi:hypothetical protein
MLANWVKQSTTSSGAGNLTLASVSGYPTFSQQFGINQPFSYTILDDATLAPIETGWGKMTSATNFVRTLVLNTMVGGTFTTAGATAATLPAGTYQVICASSMQLGGVTAIPGFHPLASVKAAVMYPHIVAANGRALVANTPLFVCGRIEAGRGLLSLGANVTTLGGAGTDKFRMGVYSINPDGSIGDLVCQTGDMLPNTTGMKSASIVGGTYQLPPAWYYVAFLSTVAVTVKASQGGNATIAQTLPTGMEATGANTYNFGSANAVAAGWAAMPSTLVSASLTSQGSDFAPIVYIYT